MLLESHLLNVQQDHYQSHENCDYLPAGSNSPKKKKFIYSSCRLNSCHPQKSGLKTARVKPGSKVS